MKKGGMLQTRGKGSHRPPKSKAPGRSKKLGGQSRYGALRPNRGGKHRKR